MLFRLHLLASEDLLDDALFVDDKGGADGSHCLLAIHHFLTPGTHHLHQRLVYISNQGKGQLKLFRF